jgi:hypothetical protein
MTQAREALSAPAPRGGVITAVDDVIERIDHGDQRGAAKVTPDDSRVLRI